MTECITYTYVVVESTWQRCNVPDCWTVHCPYRLHSNQTQDDKDGLTWISSAGIHQIVRMQLYPCYAHLELSMRNFFLSFLEAVCCGSNMFQHSQLSPPQKWNWSRCCCKGLFMLLGVEECQHLLWKYLVAVLLKKHVCWIWKCLASCAYVFA